MTTFSTWLDAGEKSFFFEAKLAGSEMLARISADADGDGNYTPITSGSDTVFDLPDGTQTTFRAKKISGKWFGNFFGGSLDANSRRVNINLPSAEAA